MDLKRFLLVRTALLILLFTTGISSVALSQTELGVAWSEAYANRKVFIENKGQFDKYSNGAAGEIKFVADLGTVRIFFGTMGLFYYFLEAEKTTQSERDELIERIAVTDYTHKQKEQLISKYKFKSDEINMVWSGASENLEIIPELETPDYHSYAVENLSNGEVHNFNHVKGFERITYREIYPSIDIIYEVHPISGVKYSIILHPGADPLDVQMIYDANTSLLGDALSVPTFFGEIKEHAPTTFYANDSSNIIPSSFTLTDGTVGFHLANYDNSQEVVIDPWVQTPAFTTSTAVWEVETDGFGNVYVIGGETPMQLKKYNSGGGLIWTYTTPWDTSSVWLGTLATDVNGTSYITSGTVPEIERIDNAGNMIWHTNGPGGIFLLTEFWSITFNCDNTKLIVGGTGGGAFSPKSMIYDIDVNTGLVVNDIEVGISGQSGFTPVEVRSISSSKNAKYIFLTHRQVGAINQNIGFCPGELPIFEVGNADNLAYKCENYLPMNQNGGGLKALVANDLFFYTHAGDEIHKWDLTNGTLLGTVALPGGSAQVIFGGTLVVHNSGLAVDDCGNVYAGSFDRVVKFDANLNVLAQVVVPFSVYDVVVNNNGEVLAVGAAGNNSAPGNRNGRLQSLSFAACAKYALICCDVNVCPAGPVCITDAPFALVPNTAGGTWSGVGVNASGIFDPSVAGVGTAAITYTLPCGSETIYIIVQPCNLPISVCEEATGNLTASGGNGVYTWSTFTVTPSSTPITNETECIACPATTPSYFFGIYTGCSAGSCATLDTVLTQYATGISTAAPPSYPIIITDGTGATFIVLAQNDLLPCVVVPLSVEFGDFELTCIGEKVICEWQTFSESNNDYFTIEKAMNDGVFHEIGKVDAAGTTTSEINYRFIDEKTNTGQMYYRLFQTDFDGTKKGLITKHIDCSNSEIFIYPNPFNDKIIVELGDFIRNSDGRVEVMNALGQLIITHSIMKNETLLSLDSQHLTKGVYYIRVFSNNLTFIEKMIKQ
ncbi:MAG: hypothetical protein ACI837_001390 [Crocinitomicaceae bacterium]|jgi:hypothetical protein